MIDEPHKRLQQARKNAGFSNATEAARTFRWNENTYRSHENGERGLRPPAAARYGRAFKTNSAWLLTGEGAPERLQAAVILGQVIDDGVVVNLSGKGKQIEAAEIDLPISLNGPMMMLLITTMNLYPRYNPGEIAAFIEDSDIGPRNDFLTSSRHFDALISCEGKNLVRSISREAGETYTIFHPRGPAEAGVSLDHMYPLRFVIAAGAWSFRHNDMLKAIKSGLDFMPDEKE